MDGPLLYRQGKQGTREEGSSVGTALGAQEEEPHPGSLWKPKRTKTRILLQHLGRKQPPCLDLNPAPRDRLEQRLENCVILSHKLDGDLLQQPTRAQA